MSERLDESAATPGEPEAIPPRHGEEQAACPMPETHDKYTEAHFFIEQMMARYHDPQPFRWCLNAFIQALRSVTFRIQKELRHHDGFEAWYAAEQEMMKSDPLLRAFVEGRNLVVKERNLVVNSSAKIGYFRYRKPKMWMQVPVPAELPSKYILEHQAPKLGLIPDDHSAIGEEYGVEREWQSPEIGDGSLLTLCDKAWSRIGRVVVSAHDFVGLKWTGPSEHGHDPAHCNLLTESDADPSLVSKWGWE